MQPAADLVATTAKLSARVENGHDDFERGKPGTLVMLFYRNAAPIVFDGHRAVGMNSNGDGIGETGHDFVDAVIDDLINEVVQPALIGCPNIHPGAHTYSL